MKKGIWLLIVVVLMMTLPLVFIGCTSSQSDTVGMDQEKQQDVEEPLPENTETPDGDVGLPDIEVDIVNFTFSPSEITIPLGTTVIWSNSDSVPHTVTSDDGFFDSGTILGGGTFSFTFDNAGTFPYFCTLHPYMKATIIVE